MYKRIFSAYFFTALSVVALTLQTYWQLNVDFSPWMLAFVGVSGLMGYNGYVILHAWKSQQWRFVFWIQAGKHWRVWMMLLLLLLEVGLIVQLELGLMPLLVLALFFVGYVLIRKPRQLGIVDFGKGKTVLLPLIWLYVTMWLPAMETGVQMGVNFFLMLLHRFGFLFLVAVFFDLRDVEKDRALAMETLVTGWERSRLFLVTFLVSIASSSASFLCTVFWSSFFLSVPIWIIFVLIMRYDRIKSPHLFLILGDGIMIVSAVLYFLGRFFINCPT
jgi:hypothetical protein